MEYVDKLKKARQMFGNDVIIIHRPDTDYHIASSTATPGRTQEVLEDVVRRMKS